MGPRSPQRNIWESSSRCRRLSNGLHSIAPAIAIRTSEMTEPHQLYHCSPCSQSVDTNIHKTISQTDFMDVDTTAAHFDNSKTYSSYESIE